MITCVGIACSPRRRGNTSLLLEQALEGAARGGARTELITLSDYSFRPCQGCNACSKDGECILKDDMQQIYQKLLAADRLILAAPIFSMSLNAQAKALIDRSQRFWSTKFVLKRRVIPDAAARPRRAGIFLSVCGTAFPDMFDCAAKIVRYYFDMLEMEYRGGHFYWQTDARGAIKSHPSAFRDVFEAGQRLVSED
jgi:hypothetical protein